MTVFDVVVDDDVDDVVVDDVVDDDDVVVVVDDDDVVDFVFVKYTRLTVTKTVKT